MKASLPKGLRVRNALLTDLDGIIAIVNSKNNRVSFGWVPKVVLADAVTQQEEQGIKSKQRIRVVVTNGNGPQRVVAWIRCYHRNDGVTTLHELGVAEDCQKTGIGSFLLDETIAVCRRRGMRMLRLKTPVDSSSIAYYPRFGFRVAGVYPGRKRQLNIYELEVQAT